MSESTIFTIDDERSIARHATLTAADKLCRHDTEGVVGATRFTSETEWRKLTKEWTGKHYVECWNMFAGIPPFGDLDQVKKFKNNDIAANRIWSQIQRLPVIPDKASAIDSQRKPDIVVGPADVAAMTPVTEAIAAIPGATGPAVGAPAAQDAPNAGAASTAPLDATAGPRAPGEPVAKKQRASKAPKPEPVAKGPNKREQKFALLDREQGATIRELMAVAGSQIHTERAFLSQGGAVGKAGTHIVQLDGKGLDSRYRRYPGPLPHKPAAPAHEAPAAAQEAPAPTTQEDAQAPAPASEPIATDTTVAPATTEGTPSASNGGEAVA